VTYESWAAAIPFDLPEEAAVNANPDNDLFLNLMEYALGLDPLVSDSDRGPTGGLLEVGGQSYQSFTYRRPAGDQERSDLTYKGERSIDLVNWSDTGVIEESVSAPDPVSGLVTVVLRSATSVTDPALVREFLRLVVIKQ
jgi:hypothetical protein